jgi:hypothetical protein
VADEQGEMATPNVKEVFLNSPWYADVLAANSFFFKTKKNVAYTSCLLNDKSSSH